MLRTSVRKTKSSIAKLGKKSEIVLFTAFGIASLLSGIAVAKSTREFFFKNGGIEEMNLLRKVEVKNAIRENITAYFGTARNYTIEDLFRWENNYLKWADTLGVFDRKSDPREILSFGKGKCGEYASLFASACTAIGIDVKIVVSEKADFSNGAHAWNQVLIDGSWVNVDASLSLVNSTERYRAWDWWNGLGADYFIFSFDQTGICADITNELI